jgi:hypothetical protein
MRPLPKLVKALLGLMGLLGTVLCLIGLIGCWLLYAAAVERTQRAFGQVSNSLLDARGNLSDSRVQLDRTRTELIAFRLRNSTGNDVPPTERTRRRVSLRQSSDETLGKLNDLRRSVLRAAEMALVAKGFCNALSELPLTERVAIDPETLRETGDQLSDAILLAERLSTLLGAAAPGPIEPAVDEQSQRLDGALDRVAVGVDVGVDRLGSAIDQVEDLRSRLIRCFTVTAMVCSALLIWIGAGQLSLMVRFLGGRRSRTAIEKVV